MATRPPGKAKPGQAVQEHESLLRALFDISFSRFLTLNLIRLMYVAAIMIALAVTVSAILIAFSNAFWVGIVSILIAPFPLLIYIISWRIVLELLIVLFRIAEFSREISENTSILGRRDPPADPSRY